MDEARQAALLRYCRIDEPTEDDLADLEALALSASAYLADAGVSEPGAGTGRWALYELCLKHLVLEAWDNRGASLPSAPAENPAFRRMLNQLKLTEPVSDSDTGSQEGAV